MKSCSRRVNFAPAGGSTSHHRGGGESQAKTLEESCWAVVMLIAMNIVEKKAAFLEALGNKYTVRHAARAAGVGRRTVYDWREQDADFAQAWADVREDCIERLEETMYEKALSGETLAGFFMLKGMRPTVYRDNVKIEHGGALLNVGVDLSAMTAADRLALLDLARQHELAAPPHRLLSSS